MDLFILISSLEGGGAEKVAVEIANNLPVAISRNVITIYDAASAYSLSSNHTSLVHNSQSIIKKNLSQIVALFRYISLIRQNQTKISLSMIALDNLLNIITCQITKSYPIISVHEMPSHKFTIGTALKRRIVFTFARYIDIRIVAVSEGVKCELIEIHKVPAEKIIVIHNPINIELILSLADESMEKNTLKNQSNCNIEFESNFESKDGIQSIITVGRLDDVKGQWHLIRAFAEIRKKHACQLLVCGEGYLREYLTALVKECGVADDVIFIGWQNNPYKYVAKSTLFVTSSLSESFGNVLVEAMAVGCPVVAANCSKSISEVLGSDNSCGYITKNMTGIRHAANEPLDEGEIDLVFAMDKILSDEKLRKQMSIACKERAKLFDLDVGIKKYTELFEEIMKSKV